MYPFWNQAVDAAIENSKAYPDAEINIHAVLRPMHYNNRMVGAFVAGYELSIGADRTTVETYKNGQMVYSTELETPEV